ncbi:MAG: hypothetical protein KF692_09630 [Cryobacterium sp.]|nr:hypothetical protein [Micrococcales bacterium]MBX3079474.1 hypothetical protein [Cryobacterium sp.]
MKSTGALILTILGVIASIVIAWWLVNLLLSVVFFIVKILIVAVVAALVFVALRGLLFRRDAKQG